MSGELDGAVVIVTGAGAGIGRAIVDGVIAAGAKAIAWDVDAAALRESKARHGVRLYTQCVNISDWTSVMSSAATLATSFARPTHLVNNAGIIGRRMRLSELEPDEVDRILSVNVKGLLSCTRAFLEVRAPHRAASIVNLSSISARSGGMPGNAVYAATKGAIASITVAAAKELAPSVRVNAIAPGVINTAIQADVFADRADMTASDDFIPMRRPGEPGEVAAAAIWLMSPSASYVTGTVLDVDGGVLTPLWSPAWRT